MTTQAPWLTAEEQATWRAFNTVSRLIEGALDRQPSVMRRLDGKHTLGEHLDR